MSYILDALKKSEQERKKGQVPGLGTVQGLPGPGGRFETDRLIKIYILATILLLVTLALGAWLFMREPEPTPPAETPPPATAQPPATDKAAPPATAKPARPVKTATNSPPAPTSPKSGKKTAPKPSPSESTKQDSLNAVAPKPFPLPTPPTSTPVVEIPPAAPVQLGETSPGQPFAETKEQEESEAPVKPELLPTVPWEELPAETRAEMPEIKIGVHLYSETPASRRASINGRLMREGQSVDKDLVLVEIIRQGAIFSFRGRKFSLPVFPR